MPEMVGNSELAAVSSGVPEPWPRFTGCIACLRVREAVRLAESARRCGVVAMSIGICKLKSRKISEL